jgi:hypothetical protein
MDMIIKELLKLGAPWICVAIFAWLFYDERKKSAAMADKLYDLGMAQVKKDTEVHQALQLVQKDVEEIRRLHD